LDIVAVFTIEALASPVLLIVVEELCDLLDVCDAVYVPLPVEVFVELGELLIDVVVVDVLEEEVEFVGRGVVVELAVYEAELVPVGLGRGSLDRLAEGDPVAGGLRDMLAQAEALAERDARALSVAVVHPVFVCEPPVVPDTVAESFRLFVNIWQRVGDTDTLDVLEGGSERV
jgi:hypothetical protein